MSVFLILFLLVAGESIFWWKHNTEAAEFGGTWCSSANWNGHVAKLHLHMFV